jgi:signal transduction histidine kinase
MKTSKKRLAHTHGLATAPTPARPQNRRPSLPEILRPSYRPIPDQVGLRQKMFLTQMLEALSAEVELDIFLGQVVSAIAQQIGSYSAYLCLHCKQKNILHLKGHFIRGDANPGPAHSSLRLERTAPTGPLWEELVQAPHPLCVTHAQHDPRVPFRDLLPPDGFKTLLIVPLASGKEVLGLICITIPPRVCIPEKIELAQELAQQTFLALKLASLSEKSRDAAILEERNRIARDIHDTLAQSLTGIVIQMDLAEEVLLQDGPQARNHISAARRLASESLVETRRSLFGLRAPMLEEHSLATALQRLAAELTSNTEIRLEFSVQGKPVAISPEMEMELLRIAQEALTNVVKHAQSIQVRITLITAPNWIRLSIRDDGPGFDLSIAQSSQGFGLIGMRERACNIGGLLAVHSRPGAGTLIQVTVPLEPQPVLNGGLS